MNPPPTLPKPHRAPAQKQQTDQHAQIASTETAKRKQEKGIVGRTGRGRLEERKEAHTHTQNTDSSKHTKEIRGNTDTNTHKRVNKRQDIRDAQEKRAETDTQKRANKRHKRQECTCIVRI